ncbi:MAG: hypothetical protein JST43_08805 [Bacteroidetes bacterium]|nr:hypothetical protein [Bacteroidota bacterium]MBS1541386.1 hypothetical protein [Bacteroidota bacterium]
MTIKITLVLLLSGVVLVQAQKIDGVYFGEIITPRNALFIESNNGLLKGSLYLNDNEKLEVTGSIGGDTLQLDIRQTPLAILSLRGELKEKSIKLFYLSGGKKNTKEVFKISDRLRINIKDLFSEKYDALLLGSWVNIESVSRHGTITKDKNNCIITYSLHGNGRFKAINFPVQVSDDLLTVDIDWETKNDELTQVFTKDVVVDGKMIERIVQPPVVSKYKFKNDTLILMYPSGGQEWYKRK